MTDLRLAYNPEIQKADLSFDGIGIETDDGLETACIISLFTDRRARTDDVVPGDQNDRRGHWGDALADEPGDRIGSRLWLLSREKQLQSVVVRAKEYAIEALQWIIDDGIATQIDVYAEISSPGVLGLLVTIYRPQKSEVDYRYQYAWEQQALRAA